ncbi:unnamed protein product [Urochloa decumbens]|uniref:F-box domain-containing protein n=1 Tax=Urochloa decumbens TaxID=240449 RepID=A0ABC9GE96_9POAL
MSPPRAPPELIADAVAEILLRIPPDEPADLLRASLVCKPWLRVASDPAFLRRYRAFHRGAPLLGFFYSIDCRSYDTLFIPTTAARAQPLRRPADDDHNWLVRDCRHGRVLLRKAPRKFAVWDPITGHLEELPKHHILYSFHSAVVLCAVAGCDHRNCHDGPFRVLCVGSDRADMAIRACVYSSETSAWGTLDSAYLDGGSIFEVTRPAIIGDEIYCLVDFGANILKYDLVKHCFSLISLPAVYEKKPLLMQNADGSLGLAGVTDSRLHLWSWKVNSEGVTGWVPWRVIKLKRLPNADVFGFAEGVGVFLLGSNAGVFTFDLKSGRMRDVGKSMDYCTFFPLISFFTPDYACGKSSLLAEAN